MQKHVEMFAELVVRPVLRQLGLYSHVAEMLMLGTAAQESQFKYLRQIGSGPALGIFQMEPATHNDVWENWLRYRPVWNVRARRWARVSDVPGTPRPMPGEMTWNLRYAATMARLQYYRRPEALPRTADPHHLAHYWKNHYNTLQGSGTVNEFVRNFHRYIG